MYHFNLSADAIRGVLPAVARAIAHSEIIRHRLQIIGFLFLALTLTPYAFPSHTLFPGNLVLPPLDASARELATALFSITLPVLLMLNARITRQSADAERGRKYEIVALLMADSYYRGTRWLMFPAAAVLLSLTGSAISQNQYSGGQIESALATSGVAILWLSGVCFLWFQLCQGAVYRWFLPLDVALVCALVRAVEILASRKASDWRSFDRRHKIAMSIRAAADILDGPMVWVLGDGDGKAEGVRRGLATAAAQLREKLGWLATPRNDTREYLAQSLASALIAVAIGDLNRLAESSAVTVSGTGARGRSWLFGAGRWLISTFWPVAVLWLGWRYVPGGDATRAIFVQATVLWVLVGTSVAIDPQGREKITSVVSAGTMFGWGKSKPE